MFVLGGMVEYVYAGRNSPSYIEGEAELDCLLFWHE